jgi:hypothetical protein
MKKWLRIAGVLLFAVCLTGCPILNLVNPSKPDLPDGSGDQVLPPLFSVATGTYQTGFELTISCETPGAVIYYSTDGLAELWSGPSYTPITDNMDTYTGPLQIDEHTTIWACSVKPGMEVSAWRRVDYAIIPDDTANLIGNGDFSLGQTLWMGIAQSPRGAQGSFSYDENMMFLNQIAPGDEPWGIILFYRPPVLVEEGRIYSFTFDAMASQNRRIQMSIGENGRDLNENGEIYDKYLMGNYDLTPDWQTFSSEFAMLNPDDDDADFCFFLGQHSGDVWIKNIQFHVREPLDFDPASIPDEQFRLAIAANVGVDVADLTELHLRGLTRFEPLEHPITDLTGIGQLSNLRDLRLWGTELTSLEPLLALGSTLQQLHCQGDISDVAMLSILTAANFPNLTNLFLGDAEKMQTTAEELIDLFGGLPVMHAIGMDSCAVDDSDFTVLFDEVINHTQLRVLHLGWNNLTNTSLEQIATLTQLLHLKLRNNPVSDITFIASLDQLINLDLASTAITDLGPLRGLYDAGAFRTSFDGRNIDIRHNNLDLRPGTANREVVDYLVDKGVFVRWQDGNIHELLPWKIAVVTMPADMGEEEYYMARRMLAEFGAERLVHELIPSNFLADPEGLAAVFDDLAADTAVKAMIVVQAVEGTAQAIAAVRASRPDMLIVLGSTAEALDELAASADFILNTDLVERGAQIAVQAHQMGATTLVHYSFDRHMGYELIVGCRDSMAAAAADLGMTFIEIHDCPDPLIDGTQATRDFISDDVPLQLAEHGMDTAFFGTNCAMMVPLIQSVITQGGIFPVQCCPSPFHALPAALGISVPEERKADAAWLLDQIAQAVADQGAGDRIATWPVAANMLFIAAGAYYAEAFITDPDFGRADFDELLALMKDQVGDIVSLRVHPEYANVLFFLADHIVF